MKTLFLVRHAKSSRDDPSLRDRDRPLNERGQMDASMMGRRLAKRHVKPDLLVSSPALRALTTAQLLADELGRKRKDIVVDERLYASSPDDLLAFIHGLDGKLARVMLFGHNPEFSESVHQLSSEIADMPTCAVAEFDFDIRSWSDVGTIAPVKTTLHSPKRPR